MTYNDEEDEMNAQPDFGKPWILAGWIAVFLVCWFFVLAVVLIRHMP
jgi:hypothetical protein